MDEPRYFRVRSEGLVCPLVREGEGQVKLRIAENTEAWYPTDQVDECPAPESIEQRDGIESP